MFRQLKVLAEGQDKDVLGVLLLSALCMTGLYYFASAPTAVATLRELGLTAWSRSLSDWAFSGDDSAWRRRLYWAATSSIFYLLVPVVAIKLFSDKPLRHYGLSVRRESAFWCLYGCALIVMVPLVLIMSGTQAFQAIYPFYKPSLAIDWPIRWLIYEAAYVVQFFALEFFFRGFMVHGLRPKLGLNAIAVMMLPYCMLHFGKPLPETLASIMAGLILGLISYRSRSIALGFLLHATVALLMDGAVLWRRGFF